MIYLTILLVTILQESYTDPEKIKQLIALGDISSLGPNLAPKSGAEHDLKPAQDTTFAYHRDRGESWDHTKPKTVSQLDKFSLNFEFDGIKVYKEAS